MQPLEAITADIEEALLIAAGQALCDRDQRGAVLVRHVPLIDPYPGAKNHCIVSHGWNGLPGELLCSRALCAPGDRIRSCAGIAEHAETMAIRHAARLGSNPKGMDMVHAKAIDGAIVVSRPPPEKACMSCAVDMMAWGVAGIWLFVEGGFTEPLGSWTRWSVADYYQHAAKAYR